jgi:Tol biopolymer transport system component
MKIRLILNRNRNRSMYPSHRYLYLMVLLVGFLSVVSQGLHVARADEDAQALEQPFLSNIHQLIFKGKRSGEGYFSADGLKMIFQSEREPGNPFYQMYVMDLDTGNTRRVSTGVGKATCGWIHPNAGKVLFAASHQDPEAIQKQDEELEKRAAGKESRYSWSFDEYYDIYETDLQGGPLRNLTNVRGYDAEGSWSPDGKRIVFASNRDAYGQELSSQDQQKLTQDPSYFMDLYIMNTDGSQVRRLTTTPGYDGGPFFSPDGAKIVWRRFSENGATAEIWTMNVEGTDQRQLTRLGVMSWAPYYHPSGDYIIFTTSVHGHTNFELYIVDAKGRSNPRRITYTEGFDGLPVFSPDGKKLAWSSSRTPDHKPQIFLAEWNDGHARRLLGLPMTTDTAPMEERPCTK